MNERKRTAGIRMNLDAAYTKLLEAPGKPGKALFRFFIVMILYEIAIAGWYVGGAELTAPAIIPIKDYYLAELFFLIPVFFLAVFSASVVAYLLGKLGKSESGFDDYLTLIIHAAIAPTLITLAADLVQAFFFVTGIIPQSEWLRITSTGLGSGVVLTYLGVYVAGFLFLFSSTFRRLSGFGWPASSLTGILMFAVYHSYLFVFIR